MPSPFDKLTKSQRITFNELNNFLLSKQRGNLFDHYGTIYSAWPPSLIEAIARGEVLQNFISGRTSDPENINIGYSRILSAENPTVPLPPNRVHGLDTYKLAKNIAIVTKEPPKTLSDGSVIFPKESDVGGGTGFLFGASHFMTANHVAFSQPSFNLERVLTFNYALNSRETDISSVVVDFSESQYIGQDFQQGNEYIQKQGYLDYNVLPCLVDTSKFKGHFRFASPSKRKLGQPCFAISYPNYQDTKDHGDFRVRWLSSDANFVVDFDDRFIYFLSDVAGGSSGCPLLDSFGNIIGILHGTMTEDIRKNNKFLTEQFTADENWPANFKRGVEYEVNIATRIDAIIKDLKRLNFPFQDMNIMLNNQPVR
jgi:Trypsin-like peptidase domain